MATAPKTHLPLSRIHTIMKSSSDSENISKESSQMMARAAELFIKSFTKRSYELANNGRHLDYKHLAEVVNDDDKYEFIQDIIPKKITVLEYKKILEKKKKNHSDDDDDDDEEESGSDEESDDGDESGDAN